MNANAATRRIRELEQEISRLHSSGFPDLLLLLKEVSSQAQTAVVVANETKREVQKLRSELRKVSGLFAALLKEQDYKELIEQDQRIQNSK